MTEQALAVRGCLGASPGGAPVVPPATLGVDKPGSLKDSRSTVINPSARCSRGEACAVLLELSPGP